MGSLSSASAPASPGASAFSASTDNAGAASNPNRVTVICPGEIPKHVAEGLAPGTALYARVSYDPS